MNALRYRSPLLVVACFGLAIAASGCGKTAAPSSPAPSSESRISQQAADDVALQFATSLSRQKGLPLTRVGSTSMTAIAQARVAPALLGRTGVERTQDEGTLSWSLVLTFYDAAGNVQQVYDPVTTARIAVRAKVRGSMTSAEHQATIGSDRTLDVVGLLPAESTIEIDGSARDTADCSFEAADGSTSRRYHVLGSGDLTDIRQLKDESVNPYPLSGSAHWAVVVDASSRDASGTTDAHYEATVLITFNGTRYPTIEVSESYRYRMDLETGEIQRLPA